MSNKIKTLKYSNFSIYHLSSETVFYQSTFSIISIESPTPSIGLNGQVIKAFTLMLRRILSNQTSSFKICSVEMLTNIHTDVTHGYICSTFVCVCVRLLPANCLTRYPRIFVCTVLPIPERL